MIQVSGLLEWSEMFGKLIERGVMLVLIHVNHQSSPNQHSVTEESLWFGKRVTSTLYSQKALFGSFIFTFVWHE